MEKKKVFIFLAKVIGSIAAGILLYYILFEWMGADYQTGRSALTNMKVLVKVIGLIAIGGSVGYQAFRKFFKSDTPAQEEDSSLVQTETETKPQEQAERQTTSLGKKRIWLTITIAAVAFLLLLFIGILCRDADTGNQDGMPIVYQQETENKSPLLALVLNEKEKKIIGKWNSSFTEQVDEAGTDFIIQSITQEATDEFLSDKTEVERGILKYRFTVDEGVDVVLEYERISEGVWTIEGNAIITKGSRSEFNFIKGYPLGVSYSYSYGDYYVNKMKEKMEDVIEYMRQSQLEPNRMEITSLTDKELILKEEDGTINTLTRIE